MRTPALLLAAALAVPSGASAWGTEVGNGKKVTQARAVAPFEQIELLGHLDVEVTEGPAQAVSVTIDENLQPLVVLEVSGKKLRIDVRESCRYQGEGRVTVAVPSLTAFAIRGSGDARIAAAEASRDVALAIDGSGNISWKGKAGALTAAIRGSGDMALEGSASRFTVAVDGSGDVKARALSARDATLAISGSGDIVATVQGGKLAAAIDGSGDIVWYGDARPSTVAVSGSGSVRHGD